MCRLYLIHIHCGIWQEMIDKWDKCFAIHYEELLHSRLLNNDPDHATSASNLQAQKTLASFASLEFFLNVFSKRIWTY